MTRLVILGAGGHGRVVADAARESGVWEDIGFLDDRFPNVNEVDGFKVVGAIQPGEFQWEENDRAVVGIGDNSVRTALCQELDSIGAKMALVVHPAAYISPRASVGDGSVVLAQAVINTGASLGPGCIVNSGACIEHDCVLGDGVHVSPGAHLAGGVSVGSGSWIGIGAAVKEGIVVGSLVTVGAGAAVVANVADGATVVGVPARPAQ